MTSLLDVAVSTLDAAQIELAEAEIAAIEATARAADARESVARLVAAVAALNGETPAEPSAPCAEKPALGDEKAVNESESKHPDTAGLSSEEFDAERKRKQRIRQKELDAQNPLAQYACAGCGAVGTSTEQLLTTPSGAQVRIIGCSECGNQTFI